jgi:hypothetical protein
VEPSPPVDIAAETRRMLETLHVELAFADIVRMAEAPADLVVDEPGGPAAPARPASPPAPAEVPLGVLRVAAVVAGVLGLVLTVLGFVTHALLGLLALFLLPAFVLVAVLVVEQVALVPLRRGWRRRP